MIMTFMVILIIAEDIIMIPITKIIIEHLTAIIISMALCPQEADSGQEEQTRWVFLKILFFKFYFVGFLIKIF